MRRVDKFRYATHLGIHRAWLKACTIRSHECVSYSTSSSDATPPLNQEKKLPRRLLVGLGNPGKIYDCTRHNIGAQVVTNFVTTFGKGDELLETWKECKASEGKVSQLILNFKHYGHYDLIDRTSARRMERTKQEGVPYPSVDVSALLPTTYMNRSGTSVRNFMEKHKWKLKNNAVAMNQRDEILLVVDDISIPFGTVRFRPKGSHGGQNGLKDVIKCVGTHKFARLRVGVGNPMWFREGGPGFPEGDIKKYVLEKFNATERDEMVHLQGYCSELIRIYVHRGVEAAASVANAQTLEEYKANR